MKPLRQAFAVTILSLTLAIPVLAGHMDTTGAQAPTPPPPSASTTSTTTTIVLTIISLFYR